MDFSGRFDAAQTAQGGGEPPARPSAAGLEWEIKLAGSPKAVRRLMRSFTLRALAEGPCANEDLTSTYFDTPDGRLAAEGASLQLRCENGALVQAFKQDGPGGGALRRDCETPLFSRAAFPAVTGDGFFDALLLETRGRRAPVLHIDIKRRTRIARRQSGARVAIAGDVCATAVPGSESAWQGAFAEARLGLISGAAGDLFFVARLCLKESKGALRLSATSKVDRAPALISASDAARLAPQNKIPIEPSGSAKDALDAALCFCAQRVMVVAPAVAEQQSVDAVRHLRVALRRFRSIERVFRAAADDRQLKKLARRAKHYAGVLGAARDWDIFLSETIPPIAAAADAPGALDEIVQRAMFLREEAWDRLLEEVRSAAFNVFCLDLLEAATAGPARGAGLRAPVSAFSRRALDERLRDAHKVAADLDHETPAAGHPLRIALKKMRYTAQLFRDVYPKDLRKPYMRAMSELQDQFGALNDAVVAQELADRAAEGASEHALHAAGFVTGYRAVQAQQVAQCIGQKWADFATQSPFWRLS